MANYNQLRNAIVAVIRQNGNNEITGDLLQGSLLSMITALGTGFNYVGLANPGTNPGTPDPNVFYLTNGNGIYAGFGGLNVVDDEAAFLKWNGAWVKETTNIATQSWVNGRGYVAASSLFENGLIKASLLPGFVDDVKEYPSLARFPRPGESDKIYIATDTNKQYRWSGTQYVEISKSLALGHTASTAYPGDEGLANANAIATLNGYFTNGVANSALKLANSRTLWGQNFDGSANILGNMSNVGQMTFSTQTNKHDVDLEVVEIDGQRYLHTHLPFFSDSQIAAGGIGTGGGGGGTGTVTAIQIGTGGTIYEPVSGSTTIVIPSYPTRDSLGLKALAFYDSVPLALGYTPYNASNPSGYISSIDYTMVINALGYTPARSSDLDNYLSKYGGTLDGDLTITDFLDVDGSFSVGGIAGFNDTVYLYKKTECQTISFEFADTVGGNNGGFRIGRFDETLGGLKMQFGQTGTKLEIINYGWTNALLSFSDSGNLSISGNFVASGQVVAGQASDARLKDNIKRLNDITILRFLRPVEFDWNATATAKCAQLSGHDVGLIAQEVAPFIPSAISDIFGDYMRIDYTKVVPYLICGWQNHEDEIYRLRARVAELEKEVIKLKS